MFLKYPSLSKFGNTEVENIEYGTTHVFPKLDGTNASVWFNRLHEGEHEFSLVLGCGSRTRDLTASEDTNDNAGFRAWVKSQCSYGFEERTPLEMFFREQSNQKYTLYGEWLVPHTITTYRHEAWRKFWIFDVYDRDTGKFLPYDVYKPLLDEAGLDYIPCVKIVKNGAWDHFMHEAQNNSGFMLPEGHKGEGVVIKNYEWTNRFQQVTWAKIVLGEFKDSFHAKMGANVVENKSNAQFIVDKACTEELIRKEYAKIVTEEDGWTSKMIPRLLHTVYYCVVKEELWDCLKEIKMGSINFKELQQLCILKTKQTMPELF